jgi:hypothetical protein
MEPALAEMKVLFDLVVKLAVSRVSLTDDEMDSK